MVNKNAFRVTIHSEYLWPLPGLGGDVSVRLLLGRSALCREVQRKADTGIGSYP